MPEPKKVGRPSRKDELRRAIDEISIDPDIVDPHRILAAIAIDPKVAAMTRITACVALIEHPRPADPGKNAIIANLKPSPGAAADPAPPDDEITRRTFQIMKRGNKPMSDMPIVEQYRGVGIHAFQSRQRIDEIVKPAIDVVFTMYEQDELWAYILSIKNPPDARVFAADRLTAISELAADKRLPRPKYDLRDIRAAVAGVASHWACRRFYCRIFDNHDQAAPRPPELGKQLEEYFHATYNERQPPESVHVPLPV